MSNLFLGLVWLVLREVVLGRVEILVNQFHKPEKQMCSRRNGP